MPYLFALLLSGVLAVGAGPDELPRGTVTAPGAAVHRFHVSYGRMAVEKNVAVCNIRFFKHDLEEALQGYHHDADFLLGVTSRADSLYAAYFNDRFHLETDGQRLAATVVGSGEETIGRDEMWWYTMQFEAPAPIRTLTITNTLLFDLFDDQKNIFKVRHFPSEAQKALYFTDGAEQYSFTF